jgi:hypothetical protein
MHTYYGRFPFNGLTSQTRILVLYQWKDLVYVSQISSENGPRSNFISIFRSGRSESQTFCVPFNNLTVLTVLINGAPREWAK